jgi:TonB family protein
MLELKPRPTQVTSRSRRGSQDNQPRRLALALALLLIALVAVVVRDRQFWFPSDESTLDSDSTAPEAAHVVAHATSAPSAPSQAKSIPTSASAPKKSIASAIAKTAAEPKVTDSQSADSGVVATTRTVLPPLDVEVVAGDTHHRLHPGSNATKVEITSSGSSLLQSAPATNAAERESIADATPSYPLLAQHMNVQGSVVLQALIGTDGVVQNLRVLNGPPILVSAAQQAVREWRFKPIVQNGQAVESKAMITVNFSIKVADNSAKTTLADSRASETLIITR